VLRRQALFTIRAPRTRGIAANRAVTAIPLSGPVAVPATTISPMIRSPEPAYENPARARSQAPG
jgi:hypothetical protein